MVYTIEKNEDESEIQVYGQTATVEYLQESDELITIFESIWKEHATHPELTESGMWRLLAKHSTKSEGEAKREISKWIKEGLIIPTGQKRGKGDTYTLAKPPDGSIRLL